jgi:hypothetical protein
MEKIKHLNKMLEETLESTNARKLEKMNRQA